MGWAWLGGGGKGTSHHPLPTPSPTPLTKPPKSATGERQATTQKLIPPHAFPRPPPAKHKNLEKTLQEQGLKDERQVTKVSKLARDSQKQANRMARAGEADR